MIWPPLISRSNMLTQHTCCRGASWSCSRRHCRDRSRLRGRCCHRAELAEITRHAVVVQADTGDEAQVHSMLQSVLEQLGGVEVLVNNAGTLSRYAFLDLPFEEWRRVLRTNLDGYFLVGQAVARHMVATGTRGC